MGTGPLTFADRLNHQISLGAHRPPAGTGGECHSPAGQRCRLCHASRVTYEQEIPHKRVALQEHWDQCRALPWIPPPSSPAGAGDPDRSSSLPPLAPLVLSPHGRYYRTVSKRKVFADRRRKFLGLIDPGEFEHQGGFEVGRCAIEPDGHAAVYSACAAMLDRPHLQPLVRQLRYVIVKGGDAEQTVLFSVAELQPELLRAANHASKTLTRTVPAVSSVFLYEDTSDGRYYLGKSAAPPARSLRKLHGKAHLERVIAGKRFLFSPLVFSQVNAAAAEEMVRLAGELLEPRPVTRLLDLYCGFGMFALALAGRVARVLGVESSPLAIAAAVANASAQRARNVRFVRADIDGDTIDRLAGTPGPHDFFLLDPPRSGTRSGVLEAIAARRPHRILHIFCNPEVIAPELARWNRCGYRVTRAVPVDMFPGTDAIEVMVVLERA